MPEETVRLRLMIDVQYRLNGIAPTALADCLRYATSHLAEEGFFTANSAAEVVEWNDNVSEIENGRITKKHHSSKTFYEKGKPRG